MSSRVKCTNANCKYLHPKGQAPKKPCTWGKKYTNLNCKFSHPDGQHASMKNKEEWVEVPVCGCPTQCGCATVFKSRCRDFKETGKCPRGDKCRFAH